MNDSFSVFLITVYILFQGKSINGAVILPCFPVFDIAKKAKICYIYPDKNNGGTENGRFMADMQ